jgi:predicted NUDIX family NTP pyrophosphohydrolase
MRRSSGGLLLFRRRPNSEGQGVEVFLVHPGGPFFQKMDAGVWSIPKGEYPEGEDPLAAARREFTEETGFAAPQGNFVSLGDVRQSGGKVVSAWALEGDCPTAIRSNTFAIEWPPRSGKQREFPEVDRAAWFPVDEAKLRIHKAQAEFLARLLAHLQE